MKYKTKELRDTCWAVPDGLGALAPRLLDSVKRMLTSTGGAGAAVFCWVGFGRSKEKGV